MVAPRRVEKNEQSIEKKVNIDMSLKDDIWWNNPT